MIPYSSAAQPDALASAATRQSFGVDGTASRRPRLVMLAYACDPTESMEARLGWRRALLAAESCDVTVLCGPDSDAQRLAERAAEERGARDGLRFVSIGNDWLSAAFSRADLTYYWGYRRWNALALRVARQLHEEQSFDVAHQVSFCGYREPGLMWRLGVPFVWGPVGGTQNFPWRFLRTLGVVAAAREAVRNVLNACQMRMSPRVRGAARQASLALAATRLGRSHLKNALGVDAEVQLETGLDCTVGPPREHRDENQPLKILWAGRLRPWKAFPLLIRALQQLPQEFDVQVRVLGEGPCEAPWRRLARRAGVADRIEWVGWDSYQETLPHYCWADVFAFTSLRDTSGTGLLEALAAGAPIVGLDHQGAADIMTDDCAVRVPVTTPQQSAQTLADAIVDLAADSDRLLHLSRGAQRRAADYDWSARADWTSHAYRRAIGPVIRPAGVPVEHKTPLPASTTSV